MNNYRECIDIYEQCGMIVDLEEFKKEFESFLIKNNFVMNVNLN